MRLLLQMQIMNRRHLRLVSELSFMLRWAQTLLAFGQDLRATAHSYLELGCFAHNAMSAWYIVLHDPVFLTVTCGGRCTAPLISTGP